MHESSDYHMNTLILKMWKHDINKLEQACKQTC